ncbi:hypothetical protein J7394_01415 [Ruegeria sp. R13_0]|uniref:hypothetical protein n=1 Tax=Ruegeria sp. R13_0 TaxID=2821099 RepID=UPI001ADB66AB|nr:hypothetical protein [Ruegeria sp. R13_0]MBO9432842.1 hypothetical protein [Ruegeria sp. R13_0]
MVQNNKVLTVSYGTFSCTLEGFDDSFETMKAIAEYFRDLAAEDRYFGSEPPQPDAEMLTRIAQRDNAQQVEARPSDTGLLLRATETPPRTETPAFPDAPPAPKATLPQEDAMPQSPDLNVVQPTPSATPETDTAASFFSDAAPVDADAGPAPDSLAAKLQRIRAVVSHSDVDTDNYAEEEVAPLKADAPAPMDAVAAAFAAGSLSPEDLAPQSPAPTEEPAVEAVEEAHAPDAPAVESAPLVLQDETPLQAESEDAVGEETPEVIFAEFDEDAETASDDSDEVENILSPADEAEDDQQGVLTAEDEESLFLEIDEIEEEMDAQATTASSDLDQDVSRLMAKADEQMDDPTASGTREAYSHLRTAVAATSAEDVAKKAAADEEYRGDLASVVSPRRPDDVQVTSERPNADMAAPLKLVAAQRIDAPNADTGPVTPRRVTSDQSEDASEESGFALFAQDQGAQSLSDLLEAAAAYLSFIEGQEQFSRPQLMNKVRSLKQDEFNREESLKSFGQLLRDGKIEKAGGGRFAASSDIGFRPEGERAVG